MMKVRKVYDAHRIRVLWAMKGERRRGLTSIVVHNKEEDAL